MSFNLLSTAPAALVVAGCVALILGYPTAGWLMIGMPIVLGAMATVWYLLKAWWTQRKPPA